MNPMAAQAEGGPGLPAGRAERLSKKIPGPCWVRAQPSVVLDPREDEGRHRCLPWVTVE